MFNTVKKLKKAQAELKEVRNEIEAVSKAKSTLEKELKELKLDKTIEKRDIAHMIKVKEEKNSLELQREKLDLEKEFIKKESDLNKKHHNAILETTVESQKDLKSMYSEVMKRLPNVNVEVKRSK